MYENHNTNMVAEIALLILVFMSLVFILATIKKDNSIVDIAWGSGFIIIALFTLLNSNFEARQLLVTSLIVLWGLRLALHILIKNWGKPEDFRYKAWRESWKHFYLRSFFQIYMLQGFLMILIALPVIVVNTTVNSALGQLDYLGVLVWLIGFFFEAVGDYQLTQFKKKKTGGIMRTGVWKYTRHPNYFGEVTMWWGVFLIALQQGIITLISPLVITFFILKVSGIPMLEAKYEKNKEYQQYKKTTNAFFPWFPKTL